MMSQDQLRQFAEACGYRLHPEHAEYYDSEGKQQLARFTYSKDAVIEALEHFCGALLDYELTRQRANPSGALKFYQCAIWKYWTKEGVTLGRSDYGGTINEAIILAVLSTLPSPKPQERE